MFLCSVNTLDLIEAVIDPIRYLIFSLSICVNICANQIMLFICTSTGQREYVVNIPTAVDYLATMINTKVVVAISFSAHKISMEVLCKSGILIILFPQTKRICFTDFHRITSNSDQNKKSIHQYVYRLQRSEFDTLHA